MSDQLFCLVLLANGASTWALVGLVWFVQIVHYPQFQNVGQDRFAAYQAMHVRSTTWVVAPPMLVEAASSAALLFRSGSLQFMAYCWVGCLLTILIWISTAWLQVPRHRRLAHGFDTDAHRGLVLSNWIRTATWTIRGLLIAHLLYQILAGGLDHGS